MDKRTPLVGLLLMSVALAGCADGGGALGIEVTESSDPVTEPYTFKATGSADRFLWDFGDGTGQHEGKEVDHTFGFTDGEITVRLTGVTGEESQVVTRKLTLGTGQNERPQIVMVASSNWATPGEAVRFSGANSTDPDGDPLLFRWTCTYLGPVGPAHGGHGTPGLPFGINAFGNVSAAPLPEPDRTVDGDICPGISDTTFSRDGTVEGGFVETGAYNIDVEVRDPKSPALAARIQVFITDEVPPVSEVLPLSGSLALGHQGSVQDLCDEVDTVCDLDSGDIAVQLPNKAGTRITFTVTDPNPLALGAVEYRLVKGTQTFVEWTSETDLELPAGTFPPPASPPGPLPVTVEFRLSAPGVELSYDWSMEVVYDRKPTYLWDPPL